MQRFKVKWKNGKESILLFNDDNTVIFKQKKYSFRNLTVTSYKTTTDVLSFILDDVPYGNNHSIYWEDAYKNANISVQCSCKVRFYWNGWCWVYDSCNLTNFPKVNHELYVKQWLLEHPINTK